MTGLFDLVVHVAGVFDDLGVAYVLGGSLASSIVGEPRSTMDADMAARLDRATGERFLEQIRPDLYVPIDTARLAIESRSSFNILDTANALKVDIFVSGDGVLDRRQLDRRVHVVLPAWPAGIWMTSAEDQVLRKLDWYRKSDRGSDRQWRDVVGILRANGPSLDVPYLRATADTVGLAGDLDEALHQAANT